MTKTPSIDPDALAEAIRELMSWQSFQAAHEKIEGDWALVAATHAIAAYEKARQYGFGWAPLR